MKKIIFLFTLILAVCGSSQGYAASGIVDDCALPGPAILKSPMQNATSFSLAWTSVPGAVLYHVDILEDLTGNPVTSFNTDTTFVVVSGLQPGTAYRALVSSTRCVDDPVFGDPEGIVVSTSIIIVDILIQYECPEPSNKIKWQGNAAQFSIPVDASESQRIKVVSNQPGASAYYDFYITADGPNLRVSPVDSLNWQETNQDSLLWVKEINTGNNKFNVKTISATATEMIVTVRTLQSNLSIYASRCGKRTGRDAPEMPASTPPLTISPNPFSDYLTILQPLVPNRKAADLTVFNALGSAVYRTVLQADETRIATADWPEGVYYVQVKNGVEITTYKVVK